jgi:hypothetical protein
VEPTKLAVVIWQLYTKGLLPAYLNKLLVRRSELHMERLLLVLLVSVAVVDEVGEEEEAAVEVIH